MKKVIIAALCLMCLGLVNAQNTTDNIVSNNNTFAFKLFAEVSSSDTTNVFISPISISTALSMTYDGAKWRTAKEMRNTLGFSKNQTQSHDEFTELLAHYKNLKTSLFTIANAAVAQDNYTFLDSYFKTLEEYGAVIKTANFIDNDEREKARNEINEWVLENTNNKIEELLDKNSISELTKLVLLNAIHFKAKWKYDFPEDRTRQMVFYHPSRQYIGSFMHNRQDYNYFGDEKIQVIELPYEDNQASMFIFLPGDSVDVENFIANLNYEEFMSLSSKCEFQKVDLLLPKFKVESRYKLKETLMEMGMVKAFTGKANFNKMNGRSDLMIDNVIHQSFIEVDEQGTEAAAATAVVVREKSGKPVTYMNINRPFVYVIKDNVKNSVLFIGKLVNPS